MGYLKHVASAIAMTVTSVSASSGLGLGFAHSSLVSVSAPRAQGAVSLRVAGRHGLSITLVVKGLASRQHYEALIGLTAAPDQKPSKGVTLGTFVSDQRGTSRNVFYLPRVTAIPEVGWSLVVEKMSRWPGVGRVVPILARAVTLQGLIRVPSPVLSIQRAALIGPFLVVATIGPRMPFANKPARADGLAPDMFATVPRHGAKPHIPLTAQVLGHRVNLQVGVHVFDWRTGQLVLGLSPRIDIYRPHSRISTTIRGTVMIYNEAFGRPDLQYANDVYLPAGRYDMRVTIGKHATLFPTFDVTQKTSRLINPEALPPGVIVRETHGRFTSRVIKVHTGEKVEFAFDGVGSDAFRIGGAVSPLLMHGQTWDYIWQNKGIYAVDLVYAPRVKMRIIVE